MHSSLPNQKQAVVDCGGPQPKYAWLHDDKQFPPLQITPLLTGPMANPGRTVDIGAGAFIDLGRQDYMQISGRHFLRMWWLMCDCARKGIRLLLAPPGSAPIGLRLYVMKIGHI
eukprot:GEMP01132657.1.p1 GENE.GEMP01132657.1~~GEMP01132657.1.p1  ORF type:complete len:114 (+),score=6.19 GEMP01132657.1:88-429(+)